MAYRDVILADGPSNYWRLNEPSGTVATDLVGAKNGTISGGVTLNQPGALADGDKAMTFGGVDGKILTGAPVPIPLVCTIEAWINYGSNPQGLKNFFVTTGLAGATGDTVRVGTNGAAASAPLSASIGAGGPVAGLIPVLAGQWTHCVYVLTGSTVAFYVNGVFDRTQPFVRTTPSGGPGQFAFDPGTYAYLGTLDEVAIYSVALTPAQIAAHYASAFALSVPSGGADDDDEDDDDEARFRLQEFYGSIAGSVHVAASDSSLIPLVPARSKHTLFVQRLAPVVTTGGPANWTVQDGALPPVPLLTAPASAVAVLPVRDFGATGVPCTEGAPLLLNLSAAGAAGWLTWEGYRKLTGVETLPSATPPHYRDLVIADGASNYWRLNEPSGLTAVDQIGGANGTISGGVTLNQPGALADGDKAMTFDGTTGKIVTPIESVTIPSVFTVEAWIKIGITPQQPILSGRVPGGFATLLLYFGTGLAGIQSVYFYVNGSFTGSRAVADGQWHHVVGVQTSTTALIYVDSVLDNTMARASAASDTGQITIGHDLADVSFWSGSLDEIAIYPVALTPAQIAAHYAARANL